MRDEIEKLTEKAAQLRRIALLLTRGDELDSVFLRHYGGQAVQADAAAAELERRLGDARKDQSPT